MNISKNRKQGERKSKYIIECVIESMLGCEIILIKQNNEESATISQAAI